MLDRLIFYQQSHANSYGVLDVFDSWYYYYYYYCIIIIIIKNESGREWEHSINLKTPTPHNEPAEEKKRENSMRQKERAD